MRGGDELNHIVEGANYGWPFETLGTLYAGGPLPTSVSYGRHDKYTAPAFAWLPSVAPSSLKLIENFHPSWDGDFLMATLKDQSLYHIRVVDNHVQFAERILIGKRIRYALVHGDGRLVLWTDDHKLIFLSIVDRRFMAGFIDEAMSRAGYSPERRGQIAQALDKCMMCHSFIPGIQTGAPNLAGIFGSRIAGSSFEYSQALRAKSGSWSREALLAFLKNPEAFAPGTTMPNPAVEGPLLDDLVKVLEAAKSAKPQ